MKRIMIASFLLMSIPFSLTAADFPKVKGWKPVSEVRTYKPGNLWEYINGAAELFLAYGFQSLQSCDLSSKNLIVTVDIYNMGTPLNAFGVYSTERPRESKTLSIGVEGIVSPPYQCLLLKDVNYVKVNMYEGEIDEATGKALLEAISNALPGSDDHPEELTLLPSNGRIPGSEGFVKEGYLGLTELTHCVFADYKEKSASEYQYFHMVPGPKETTESVWKRLTSKWKATEVEKYPILYKSIPYKGIVGVILTDKGIFGVTDSEKESEMKKRLQGTLK